MKLKIIFLFILVSLLFSQLSSRTLAASRLEEEEAHASGRLLVADGLAPKLHLLDLEAGEIIASYDVTAPASLYAGPSGRYGFAVQSDGNQVNVVDSGMTKVRHEDHFHTVAKAPALLDFKLDRPQPIHFVIHHEQIALFNDGDGTATILTEENLKDTSLPLTIFQTARPHHGVAVPLGERVLVSTPDPGTEDDLPVGLEVYNLAGEKLQTLEGCPALHGEAAWDEGAAFACGDGIWLIEPQGEGLAARKLAYPADEGEESRAWTLAAHEASPVLVGDFGENGLIMIDPVQGTVTSVTLPAAQWQFKFEPEGQHLLIITVDGQVHRLDPVTGEIEGSIAAVSPFSLEGDFSDPRPALVPGHEVVYVSDPASGKVVEANLETMQVTHQFEIGGTPVDLALLGLPEAAEHDHAEDHEVEMTSIGTGQAYVVQANDSLSKLAQQFYGDLSAYHIIVEATNALASEDTSYTQITDPGRIEVGQKIFIPAAAETAPAVQPKAASQAEEVVSTRLVVSDIEAEKLYVYQLPDFELLGQVDGIKMAGHAGFVTLPDGRVLLVDGKAQELLILEVLGDQPQIAARVKVPGIAIHLAVDPSARYAAVSTVYDDETEQGKDAITLINLASLEAKELSVTTEEPGVLLGETVILHRDGAEQGQLQAFPLENALQTGPKPAGSAEVGAFGHGEALVEDHAYVATDDGVDVVHLAGTELSYETTLPWAASGREGGRAYYLRVSPNRDTLWSYLRIVNNPDDDASWQNWQDWQNDAYLVNTETDEVTRFELGPGIVYRLAISREYALYAQVHPEGDFAHLIDADPISATFMQPLAAIPLPAMSRAPQPGVEPWDAAGFRIAALTPDGRWGFVSNGGDGSITVIDTETKAVVETLTVPTPLNGGGYMVAVQPGQPLVDGAGR